MKKNLYLIILSFLGLADSIYLSLPYLTEVKTFCGINDLTNCDKVLSSEYSELIFEIPNAFLGILFYLSLLLIFIFWDRINKKVKNILKITIFLTSIGVVFYIYFIYLQKFVIKAYCPYCLVSAVITFKIWYILVKRYLRKIKRKNKNS